jgi:GT2 family glycosyltransferase
MGGNFSAYRDDIIKVGGFRDLGTYGYEDTDLERRLKEAGMKLKWIRHDAIVFHLFHPKPTIP